MKAGLITLLLAAPLADTALAQTPAPVQLDDLQGLWIDTTEVTLAQVSR